MVDLFVYGSLMFDPVWTRVVGQPKTSVPASLSGYRRYAVRDETYPAILAQSGAQVAGQLIRGLAAEQLARLDAFEGDDYRRIVVDVFAEQRLWPAHTYLFLRPDLLTDQDWDVDGFARSGIDEFMRRYGGFR